MRAKQLFIIFTILSILSIKNAAETIVIGDIKYTINDNKATVTGYLGDDDNVIIPNYIEVGTLQYPVIAVTNGAFKDFNGSCIYFPDSIRSIEIDGCYRNSHSLSIPNSCNLYYDHGSEWGTIPIVYVRNTGNSRLNFHSYNSNSSSKPYIFLDKSLLSLVGLRIWNPRYIFCRSANPPACNDTTFCSNSGESGDLFFNTHVYVPEQSVEIYKNAPYWKKFQNIFGYRLEMPQSINFNQQEVEVVEGYSKQLSLDCTPSDFDPSNYFYFFNWISSDPSIASIDRKGIVTAKKTGEVNIVYKCEEIEASCKVIVTPKQFATSISLDKTSISLHVGTSDTICAQVLPENATDKTVNWTSSNTNIATVTNDGIVSAKSAGDVIITATTTDGSNLSASCNVKVGDYVSSISLYGSKFITYVGDSITLGVDVYPSSALNQNVYWHSDNPEIAIVSQNGKVYGIGVGTAIITATATDGSGVSASCAIPVEVHVESVTLDKTNIEIFPNDVVQLYATVLPEYGTNKNLNWSSSNPNIAYVDNGLVRGRSIGTATIYAKSQDGYATATCEVTVLTEYALTAPNLQHVRGNTECNVSYPIELINNKSAISALQFDMTLPTGLSMAMKNGYPDVWLDDARKTRTHSVEANPIGTNKYRFIVSSTMNKDLVGNSGDLVHMNLHFDTIHSIGTYYINLNNIVLTESNETQHTASNTSSAVSLKYLLGDANADFSIDAADYVATAAKILSKPVPIFYSDAANVNSDNTINVTDLVGITNIALGIRPIEIRPAPSIGDNSMNSIPCIRCTTSDGNAQLAIAVENSQALAGLQMDFSLPNGFTVCDAELVGRAAKQQLGISHLPNGKVRLLVSSFSGEDISSGNDDILLITLQGVADQAEAVVDSIYAVERDLNTYELDSQTVLLGTTGISAVMTYDHVRISSDGQKIVIESPANGTAQIILLNGITRDITVKAGKNSYPMEPGYYIVRMNGQTAKIRL